MGPRRSKGRTYSHPTREGGDSVAFNLQGAMVLVALVAVKVRVRRRERGEGDFLLMARSTIPRCVPLDQGAKRTRVENAKRSRSVASTYHPAQA